MEVTERFSSRVKDYVLYRPGYPEIVVTYLKNFGLDSESLVADIGSGTGKSAEMFLANGNKVFGVEPNEGMRHAAEDLFREKENFVSLATKAEHTGLPGHSMDFVVAGQAFHWFDPILARKEFARILKPDGYAVLIWNERSLDQGGFMGDYDAFLYQYSTDYKEVDHRNIDEEKISAFFSPMPYNLARFANPQAHDFEGLQGRYDSCSYAIPQHDNRYPETIMALEKLFGQYQKDGQVVMEYDTVVYCGQL